MSMLDEWNNQISGVTSDMQKLDLQPHTIEEPIFSLDHRAEFLSQYVFPLSECSS